MPKTGSVDTLLTENNREKLLLKMNDSIRLIILLCFYEKYIIQNMNESWV